MESHYNYILLLFCLVFFLFAVTSSFSLENISLEGAIKDMRTLVEEKIAGATKDTVKTIAIYHFTDDNSRTKLGDYISSETATYFSQTDNKNIKILSRKKMDDILAEHQFQFSDFTDATKSVKIGKILNAEYIITGYIFTAKDNVKLNIQLIDIETAEIVVGNSYSIEIDDYIAALLQGKTDENTGSADTSVKPPLQADYIFFDTFDNFDDIFWVNTSINDELELKTRNGRLAITGKFRKGRLNSINDITSKPFKVQSFSVEISFRDPLQSSDAIIFSVENTDYPFFAGTAAIAMALNFQKGYYKFSWFKDGDWHYNEDALKIDFMGDEEKNFHRLRLIFDEYTKTAYGYLDDSYIDSVQDFTFKRSDKIQICFEMRESVSDTGKDVHVEFDDFKSSIEF
jgi:TolB-like protein